MNNYRKIVLILSIIVGCIAAIMMNLTSPLAKAAYTHAITQENYQILKDLILDVAKNNSYIASKDIKITMELNDNSLVINADTELYGVTATFPLLNQNWKIENGIIKYDSQSIDYNNGVYQEYTDVKPIPTYIVLSIVYTCTVASFIMIIFYYIPDIFFEFNSRKKS